MIPTLRRYAALATLPVLAACTSSADSPAESQDAISDEKCTALIKEEVLRKQAFDFPKALESRRIYGSATTDRELRLVRLGDLADEARRTDYLVVRSRLTSGGIADPGTCTIENMMEFSVGPLPEGIVDGKVDASCTVSIGKSVLAAARKTDGSAKIAGTKVIYGGGSAPQGAAIVRVSGAAEKTDYVALFSQDGVAQIGKGDCTVDLVSALHSGDVPEIAGLPNAVPKAFCTGPDGATHNLGESFAVDCNTCLCEASGARCTELHCGPSKKSCIGPNGQTLSVGESFAMDCNTCTCETYGLRCTELFCL